jgi:ATP-dependent protease ClpP protease subunit
MKRVPIFNYSVRNQGSTTLEISIDGEIVDASTEQFYKDYFGDDTSVSFKSFRDQINAAIANGVTIINGTINSPGGHVTEAMAIHDYLIDIQNKGITVNIKGQGIVASGATYILMASRNSSLTDNSWFMIHNVAGFAYGDVNEVENQAKTLRKFNNAIRDFYSTATGQPTETISGWMNKETWLTASEAREKGFVKNTSPAAAFTNTIKPEQWLFQNTAVLNSYNSSIKNPSEQMDFNKITEAITNGFNSLAGKLGITDKTEGASEALNTFSASIVNAVKESMPTQEAIQEMVNKAFTAATEKVPENVQTAIKNAVEEATKDAVTAEDLKKVTDELDAVKTDVANRAGTARPKNNGPSGASARTEHAGISFS